MDLDRRTLLAGAGAGLSALALPETAFSAPLPSINPNGSRASLLSARGYPAHGTVFTRNVRWMPLASDSAAIAREMVRMPQDYCGKAGFGWLKTSLNTVAYNLPIYVVDSANPNFPRRKFTSNDPRVTFNRLRHLMVGDIPLQPWAVPAGGGDKSLSVYDRATGIVREYFYCQPDGSGGFTFASCGITQAGKDFVGLASNESMQHETGSSAVVAMMNSLTQIGITEALSGRIPHALSFTIANARQGYSWPAKQGDGTLAANVPAPVEGQWCRIPPNVDVSRLGLRPFTAMVAKAVQQFGAYPADKNTWCHAFNAEHPINWTRTGRPDPWAPGGAVHSKFGNLDLNDFPWELTQWAPVGWNRVIDPTPSSGLWDDKFGDMYRLGSGVQFYTAYWSTSSTGSRLMRLKPAFKSTSTQLVFKWMKSRLVGGSYTGSSDIKVAYLNGVKKSVEKVKLIDGRTFYVSASLV